jgi:hypothetical protein
MPLLVASGPEFDAFQKAVRYSFGELANDCNATLVEVEPWIFGFRTPYAVVTIGGYSGHQPSLCVKLRPSEGKGNVTVMDGADIGLANIERAEKGSLSPVFTRHHPWTALEIEIYVRELAATTRAVALSFIQSRTGDWDKVRDLIAKRIEEMQRNPPWKRQNA